LRAGAPLADGRRMTKLILFPLLLLCGTAAADASQTINLGFDLTSGNDTRHYAVKLVEKECGSVDAKSPSSEDEIKVCAEADGPKGSKLSFDWRTRQGDREIRNRSTVVAARGSAIDLDGPGVKLHVTVN
jgi:hypothetical protein